jgi:hypothetical protein
MRIPNSSLSVVGHCLPYWKHGPYDGRDRPPMSERRGAQIFGHLWSSLSTFRRSPVHMLCGIRTRPISAIYGPDKGIPRSLRCSSRMFVFATMEQA